MSNPAGRNPQGTWNVVVSTPFGDQDLSIDIVVDGQNVSGVARHSSGAFPFQGGALTGDTVTFDVSLTAPVTADLKITMTFDGDTVTGTAKAGLMPGFPIAGHRAEPQAR
jgi:hypothetical protein